MISIKELEVNYENNRRFFCRKRQGQNVIDNLNLKVEKGTCAGIIGESGSGKSTLAKVICGLLRPTSGSLKIEGISIYSKKKGGLSTGIVFQDYTSSVNPRMSVKEIVEESIIAVGRRDHTVSEYLEMVGLDAGFMYRMPHELSGGQLQRVCIARALATRARVLLLDEAVSSLDAHTQLEIMELLKVLKRKYDMTYLFITHDLLTATFMCDVLHILYRGKIVESCDVSRLSELRHPYARQLMEAIL